MMRVAAPTRRAKSTAPSSQMTEQELLRLGHGELVFVVCQEGTWICRDACGTPLATYHERDTAFAAVVQYDMKPVSVH